MENGLRIATTQIADTVLMVRPTVFGPNPETAGSNRFQSRATPPQDVTARALAEFDSFVAELESADVRVVVVNDAPGSVCVDAVFPNNWFSTHDDGSLVLYPMLSPNRRRERAGPVLPVVTDQFTIHRILDLTGFEATEDYLEGTGSLVLDRVARVAYASVSARMSGEALGAFCQAMGYRAIVFHAMDREMCQVYHTNVVMSIGESFAIVCPDMIPNTAERREVLSSLASTGRKVLEATLSEAESFACNVLQLRARSGDLVVAMSESARSQGVWAGQVEHGRIVSQAMPTIETFGGGSVRCMLAEVYVRDKLRNDS